jgi:hypothetical protein
MYNSSDVDIDRIYLAEVRTGGTGDVTYLRNLPVAKTKGEGAEFQGDVTVHGEIANRGVCTAWVNFDGTQNPPLVRDSYNVIDVVDLGVGVYSLVIPDDIDIHKVSGSVTVGASAGPLGNRAGTLSLNNNRLEVRTFACTTGADQDLSNVLIQLFGGKDITGGQ